MVDRINGPAAPSVTEKGVEALEPYGTPHHIISHTTYLATKGLPLAPWEQPALHSPPFITKLSANVLGEGLVSTDILFEFWVVMIEEEGGNGVGELTAESLRWDHESRIAGPVFNGRIRLVEDEGELEDGFEDEDEEDEEDGDEGDEEEESDEEYSAGDDDQTDSDS